ncbi:IS1 family transposase [Candidatus Symbiopectobacterium sp.]|uniref:IS1 family transposase n=1 Tax=Candidatus Symbiopectobacterium sp. TaxID=2816440 RepID=UPI0025BB7F82|nr:IS1 family transposase [Candidatus Symbiopectobacterium sp.]
MAKVDVRCLFCEQTSPVKKHGYGKSGHQRYRRQSCKHGWLQGLQRRTSKIKHIVSKLYTQRIERAHLTLRNRLQRLNRKTLGYSKSSEMHDSIIGTYIEREYYV